MFEYRCRSTPAPVNGVWETDTDYLKLCSISYNNCPEDTWCGAPYEYDLDIEWDRPGEVDEVVEFNYYYCNFDNIWASMLTIF